MVLRNNVEVLVGLEAVSALSLLEFSSVFSSVGIREFGLVLCRDRGCIESVIDPLARPLTGSLNHTTPTSRETTQSNTNL